MNPADDLSSGSGPNPMGSGSFTSATSEPCVPIGTNRDDVNLISDDPNTINTAENWNWPKNKDNRDDTIFNRRYLLVLGIVCVLVMVGGVVGIPAYAITDQYSNLSPQHMNIASGNRTCRDSCVLTLVESIPQNLTYLPDAPSHPSTFQGIRDILALANKTIEIASFYWTLRGNDLPVQDPSSWEGQTLFNDLVVAGSKRGIKIHIVQNDSDEPVNDTVLLSKLAGAKVRSLNLSRLIGGGILHTKLWLIDRQHFYIGSANLDWRSFTQVKELGVVVKHCPCLADDIAKIFDAYWYLAQPNSYIPQFWPPAYDTDFNKTSPVTVQINGTKVQTYFSSSPPPLCPDQRTRDGDAIVDVINHATKFVYIAVMDYFPTTQFSKPRYYWPVIDNALREVAFNRHVKVRLLASYWNHTWADMLIYLQSLDALRTHRYVHVEIEVKLFVVPTYTEAQGKIPFCRVNHNKYMVTDQTAYIGTSNWSGDYFTSTAGIGFIINQPKGSHGNSSQTDIRQQLEDIFIRDWTSEYAFDLSHFNTTEFTF